MAKTLDFSRPLKKERFSKRKAFLFQCNNEKMPNDIESTRKNGRRRKTPAYQAGMTAIILFILTTTAVK